MMSKSSLPRCVIVHLAQSIVLYTCIIYFVCQNVKFLCKGVIMFILIQNMSTDNIYQDYIM